MLVHSGRRCHQLNLQRVAAFRPLGKSLLTRSLHRQKNGARSEALFYLCLGPALETAPHQMNRDFRLFCFDITGCSSGNCYCRSNQGFPESDSAPNWIQGWSPEHCPARAEGLPNWRLLPRRLANWRRRLRMRRRKRSRRNGCTRFAANWTGKCRANCFAQTMGPPAVWCCRRRT